MRTNTENQAGLKTETDVPKGMASHLWGIVNKGVCFPKFVFEWELRLIAPMKRRSGLLLSRVYLGVPSFLKCITISIGDVLHGMPSCACLFTVCRGLCEQSQ